MTMSLGIEHFSLFLATGVLLNLAPGQDTIYIVGRSLAQGRGAGIASALGISTGGLCHTLAAALGLSAILAADARAFQIVRFMGAGYLVYLGVRMLINNPVRSNARRMPALTSLWRIYVQGIVTNVTNPKVALFFLAFVPQFIDRSSSAKSLAFLVLGGTFMATGTLWCLVLAVAAARVREVFDQRATRIRGLQKIVGGVFVALGARLALSRTS